MCPEDAIMLRAYVYAIRHVSVNKFSPRMKSRYNSILTNDQARSQASYSSPHPKPVSCRDAATAPKIGCPMVPLVLLGKCSRRAVLFGLSY